MKKATLLCFVGVAAILVGCSGGSDEVSGSDSIKAKLEEAQKAPPSDKDAKPVKKRGPVGVPSPGQNAPGSAGGNGGIGAPGAPGSEGANGANGADANGGDGATR